MNRAGQTTVYRGQRPESIEMRRFHGVLVLLAVPLVLAVAGCAGMDRRPPPSLDQIVEMSKAGKPPEEIIRELQETRAVYPLTGSQIAKLHEQGVPPSVLDYLQNAYMDRVRWESRMTYDSPYWWNCFNCYHRPMIVRPY